MTKAHSLSWDEFLTEALAELHPWELFEYDLKEYMLMRKGRTDKRRLYLQQDYQHTRILAYHMILPYLSKKDRNKKIDQLIPDIYSDKQTPVLSLKDYREMVIKKYGNEPVTRKMLKNGK